MFIFLLFGAVTSTSAFLNSHLLGDSCTNNQFTCANSKCIDLKLRCDGFNNCGDKSDELNCESYGCKPPLSFRCSNKRCISKSYVCDGENDCDDFSDEKDCANFKFHIESTCELGHWRCTDKLCIPIDWVCNGVPECVDESDETIGCSSKIPCDGFKCKNGHCIMNEWICDGNDDCHDNSDEQDCENHVPLDQCTMDKRKFLCSNNKTCIDLHLACDGLFECPDHSDEGRLCNSSVSYCKNSKCSHQCVPLPTGPKCVCPIGYHTLDDKNCTDINECDTYGICDQKCRNTPGSYECYCEDKYILQADRKTCKARGGSGIMFFSSKKEIRALLLDSSSYFTVANKLKQVVGVAYDGHHVYWTEISTGQESIARSIENGSERELLVTAGLGLPEDLAVDYLTGNIYFTDAEKRHIGVCSNNGTHCAVLINKDIRKPRGIALNVENGDMYWTDWEHPAEIGYALMDGSKDRPFVKDNIDWPNGLALDQPNERLYWTDAKKATLESIKLDGTERRVILEGIVKHPYAMAVFEDKLYWSDWDSHTIQSCEKFDGKEHHTIVEEHKDLIYGITIFHNALQQRVVNPCDRAFCSDICLLRERDSYTCMCPENKVLGKDGHVCKEIQPTQVLIGASGNLLMQIEHQYLGKHDVTLLPSVVKHVDSLAYDSYRHMLIISDMDAIVKLSMTTGVSKSLDIGGRGRITAMDFDSSSNNLYICDLDRAVVEVIDLNTMSRKILLHDPSGDVPESIALVPEEGVMFVSFKNGQLGRSHIDRFFMDGTGRTHIIESNLAGPICLTYDRELHRIFFADAMTGVIESTSVEGDDRHHFRTLNTHIVSLASLKDNLFWINGHSKQLFWSEKKTSSSYDKKITLGLNNDPEHMHLISVTRNKPEPNACRVNNNGCSHLCLLSHKSIICECPAGWELTTDNRTCTQRIECNNKEFTCPHSKTCILKSLRCNGYKDCTYGEDEMDCVESPKCSAGQYQCNDGQCIDEALICDHNYDCRDKSDEHGCEDKQKKIGCPPEHFTCKNSECVPQRFVCDTLHDCDDGSDEDETSCVNNVCLDNKFRCASGSCISKAWECDGEYDCPDNSDEHCSLETCPQNFYKCDNNKCVDSSLVCDKINDCGDYSDEKFEKCLHHLKTPKCTLEETACTSNISICIPLSARCNGTSECPQNEDEIDCSILCSVDEFECRNTECVPKDWLCDGEDDCGDNSDESVELCSHTNETINFDTPVADPCTNGYRCRNGACINMTLVCDGKHDCYDGSDEDGLCASSCVGVGNPCNQICIKTPTGPSCECKDGYKLTGNGKMCDDDDECKWDPPLCSQLCHNRKGRYSCDCYNNFLLGNDKKSCKAEGPRMSLYFVVHNYQIREIIPQHNAIAVIFTNPMIKISSMDTIVEPKLIFFSAEETEAIYKLDPTTGMLHFIRNVGVPQKISVDWSTQNIYYYNALSGWKSISVCNFDEKCAKLVDIDEHLQVSALTVDSVNKVLFYVLRNWRVLEMPNYVIYKINLDGSNKTEIVKSSPGNVEDITFDLNKEILYFKDKVGETINSVSYKGGSVKTLFFNINQTESLTFFQNHLYYFQADGHIVSCKLYDGRKCRVHFKLHDFATGQFTIGQNSLRPKVDNVCSGHKCPYLCVPGENEYKCLCHDGRIGSVLDSCNESDESDFGNKHKFTVHSVQISQISTNASTKHGRVVATAILIPLFLLLLIGAAFYYIIKRKSDTGLNISMKFHNPLYGKKIDDQKPILQAGEHEYTNPILVIEDKINEEHAPDLNNTLNETYLC